MTTQPKKEPIDLGINSTCDVCDKRFCICPERQFNGEWIKIKEPKDFIEKKLEQFREMFDNKAICSPTGLIEIKCFFRSA